MKLSQLYLQAYIAIWNQMLVSLKHGDQLNPSTGRTPNSFNIRI